MIIGFTGTRHGMSAKQAFAVRRIFSQYSLSELHHGDCIGSDAEAHDIARAFFTDARVACHPPIILSSRAHCTADIILPAKPYLDRNRDIVDSAEILVSTPLDLIDPGYGGTWYTVRYARKIKRPVVILLRNGDVETHYLS